MSEHEGGATALAGGLAAVAAICGAAIALWTVSTLRAARPAPAPAPAPLLPSAPAPNLARSTALELVSVAEVGTAAPQTDWIVAARRGPAWQAVEVAPVPSDLAARAPAGAALAARLCAPCHGPAGRGDGPLADDLRRAPRDLTGPLATRGGTGRVSPEEVYRSLSAGAPAQGMPSFAQLAPAARWDLVAWVRSLQPPGPDYVAWIPPPAPPPPAPGSAAERERLHLGQDLFRARCALCHGPEGRGDGPGAVGLRDRRGQPAPPADLRAGPAALRGATDELGLARTIALGRPGTAMAPNQLQPDELWALAAYVAALGEVGRAERRRGWNGFYAAWRPLDGVERAAAGDPPERWNERLSRRWARAPEGRPDGCLGCHEGLAEFATGRMQVALEAFGAGHPSGTCVVCHEGQGEARTKAAAHAGLIGNPGSLWATSVGLGCAKCHSAPGELRTLHARPLPEPSGGALMHARSTRTDPSGRTSGHYTYRVQRSLMAQETGKVLLLTSSADLVDPSRPEFSDYPLADPDGAEPRVGSPAYRALIERGLRGGYLQRLERTRGLPTFSEALALCGGDEPALARAALVDYGRKNCFRCHVWGEGQPARQEHRSSGCSACHVEWGDEALYEGQDRTVPRRAAGHPRRHTLSMTPPDEQCNHCHTRNPLTLHSEPHQRAGMSCVDCHTSIDVHGDGNVYPAMEHQVEVRCQDCHGAGDRAPWELPLGFDTPLVAEAARGVYPSEGRDHLLSNRGNPRRNWWREGGAVVVESFRTRQRHVAPLLRERPRAQAAGQAGCAAGIQGHEQVSCALCHNRRAPRCGSCHMTYDRHRVAQDWLLSALAHQPGSLRQREVFTPGQVEFQADRQGSIPFGAPDTRRDRANRWAPREPGCDVSLRYVEHGRTRAELVPRFNPGTPSYPPVVANSTPHENAIPPRSCAECHPQGAGGPATLFGHVQPDRGDWWRPLPAGDPSQAARARWRR